MLYAKRYFLLACVGLAALTSCGDSNSASEGNDGEITLSGKVRYPQSEGDILLMRMDSRSGSVIDTLQLAEDSTFSVSFDPEPGYYRVNFYNRQQAAVILDDEDVNLVVDGNHPRGAVEASGSEDMQLLLDFQKLGQDVQQRMGGLIQRNRIASQERDTATLEANMAEAQMIQDSVRAIVHDKLEGNTGSLAAMQGLAFLSYDSDRELIDQILADLSEKYPNEMVVKQTADQVAQARKTAVGSMAPEIEMATPDGGTLKLSELRGKYVLIDFWAAWCKPCRMENPNVVKLYSEYEDENFEILGVSLDRDHAKWVEAIEQDGLPWKHVSDLQYFDNQAAQDYNIQAIPATVLVDPEGKIIAKDLRGKSLENKLAELFES
ncbi:peroxiredoxin family protein [Roseivirga sp. BDSF3-8]|uniref:peroxiredoxin family protein n=1 Tax=Roseivirga sp. BDSF3-8 TaxID=3241598 RepID=UPI003531893F